MCGVYCYTRTPPTYRWSTAPRARWRRPRGCWLGTCFPAQHLHWHPSLCLQQNIKDNDDDDDDDDSDDDDENNHGDVNKNNIDGDDGGNNGEGYEWWLFCYTCGIGDTGDDGNSGGMLMVLKMLCKRVMK